jgi:aminoglycoside phosphotransferase (APT) family kinase protein
VADAAIDVALVRALLREQHPDLADLELREVRGGWDNRLFRVGDGLLARLPCREVSAPLVAHELRWLPELAPRLPLPIPVPVRAGRPGCGYPWSWTIVPWLAGDCLLTNQPPDLPQAARDVARFLRALHEPAPVGAPANPWRGVPLAGRTSLLHTSLDRLDWTVDRAAVLGLWQDGLAADPWRGPALWLHGDLHPGNLLVAGGRISAVIDFGDLTTGDPATDFAIAWMLPRSFRDALREERGALDEAGWRRARGWALALAVAYMTGSEPGDALIDVGRATIAAVLE